MFRTSSRSSNRKTRRITTPSRSGRARLWLQNLEDRLTPASLVVTTSDDALGVLTNLRAIMDTANNNGEADTITFGGGVTAINLLFGQIEYSENADLTIQGGGT